MLASKNWTTKRATYHKKKNIRSKWCWSRYVWSSLKRWSIFEEGEGGKQSLPQQEQTRARMLNEWVLARKTKQQREQRTTRRKFSEVSDVVGADVYDLVIENDEWVSVSQKNWTTKRATYHKKKNFRSKWCCQSRCVWSSLKRRSIFEGEGGEKNRAYLDLKGTYFEFITRSLKSCMYGMIPLRCMLY